MKTWLDGRLAVSSRLIAKGFSTSASKSLCFNVAFINGQVKANNFAENLKETMKRKLKKHNKLKPSQTHVLHTLRHKEGCIDCTYRNTHTKGNTVINKYIKVLTTTYSTQGTRALHSRHALKISPSVTLQ